MGHLYCLVVAGPHQVIRNMSGKSKSGGKEKLKQSIDLLKFILTIDDEEIKKSAIESIIDLLEEEMSK